MISWRCRLTCDPSNRVAAEGASAVSRGKRCLMWRRRPQHLLERSFIHHRSSVGKQLTQMCVCWFFPAVTRNLYSPAALSGQTLTCLSANHAAAIECILLCRRGDDDLRKNAFISHIGGSICIVTATCLQEEVLNIRKVQDCLMVLCSSLCIRLLLILTCVEAALLLLLFSLLGGLQAFPPLQKKMWFLFLFFSPFFF